MIKAVNVVMSNVGSNKIVTFNVEVDGTTHLEPDASLKVFSTTVASEADISGAVQSILADYMVSITAPSNPTAVADITLPE